MTPTTSPIRAEEMLALMRSRRVVRSFTDAPVSEDHLLRVVEAARWATSAGNRHLHKFLIVRDPSRIRLVRSASPGMLAFPPSLIAILTDEVVAAREGVQLDHDRSTWIDVGTATMNMMNLAHALGLGTCPVTSFSRSGVAVMLDLPPHLIPELMLMVGHPAPRERTLRPDAPAAVTTRALTYWEWVGQHDPPKDVEGRDTGLPQENAWD